MSLVTPAGLGAVMTIDTPNPFTATEAAVNAQRDLLAHKQANTADASVLASPELMQALGSLFDVILKEEKPTQPTPIAIPSEQLNVNPNNVDTSFNDAMLTAIEMDVQRLLDKKA